MSTLYTLDFYPSPKGLFSGKIPDIVQQQGKKLVIIELRCPAETNFLSFREYKSDRYKELISCSLKWPKAHSH